MILEPQLQTRMGDDGPDEGMSACPAAADPRPAPSQSAGAPGPATAGIRYGGSGKAIRSWALLLTAILHCAFIAGMLATWQSRRQPTAVSSPLVVMDLAPRATPPEPVRDVAPGPEQVERERQMDPKAAAQVAPQPAMVLPGTHPATPEPTGGPANPAPTIPATTAPRSVSAPAAARLSNEARPTWEALLLAHLERFRRYPARARGARQEGTTYIRFRMNRAGAVLSASIVRRSGFTTLDQAALGTLQSAQPLPAIPAEMPDIVELTVPVEFYLQR